MKLTHQKIDTLRQWLLTLVLVGGGLTGTFGASQAFAHEARHGGALVGLETEDGEVAHLEWTVDASDGTITAYLTDASAEMPVRTPQETLEIELYFQNDPVPFPMLLTAQENPATGETVGDTSVFRGRSDRLKGALEFKATLMSLFVSGHEVSDISFSYPEGAH